MFLVDSQYHEYHLQLWLGQSLNSRSAAILHSIDLVDRTHRDFGINPVKFFGINPVKNGKTFQMPAYCFGY